MIEILIALGLLSALAGVVGIGVGAYRLIKFKQPVILLCGLGVLALAGFFLTCAHQASASV